MGYGGEDYMSDNDKEVCMAQPWTDPDNEERGNVFFNILSTLVLICAALLMLTQIVAQFHPEYAWKGPPLSRSGWGVVILAFVSFIFACASVTYIERTRPHVHMAPELVLLLLLSGFLTAVSFFAMLLVWYVS